MPWNGVKSSKTIRTTNMVPVVWSSALRYLRGRCIFLHIHCSYLMRPIIKIITLYEPDPSRWVNFRVRRQDDA